MPPKKQVTQGHFCDLTEKRGVKIYYEVSDASSLRKAWSGDKEETLFLLLGSTADLRKTTDQQYINQLVGFFKVLTYDHRNTGQSTIKDEPCTMHDYADDAAALLEAVIPDRLPVYVVGTSFGGMVAQHLALRHPHLVKKLVLCCCATGGAGGMSFPIHEWYADGVTVEDRVVRKIFQANTDRNEEWKEKNQSTWQMVYTLLTRDEKVGLEDPLRMEGAMQQLEARKGHDTWESIGSLQMDVLCCGSHKDNITPPEVMKKLVERIGEKCEAKLDFDWGHAFLAADTAAAPFVNEWLRKPPASGAGGGGQAWKVVGGADKGGIVVREGQATTSAQLPARLSTGAVIEELGLAGERLHYQLQTGTGPQSGWVSLRLPGKELVVPIGGPAEGSGGAAKPQSKEVNQRRLDAFNATFKTWDDLIAAMDRGEDAGGVAREGPYKGFAAPAGPSVADAWAVYEGQLQRHELNRVQHRADWDDVPPDYKQRMDEWVVNSEVLKQANLQALPPYQKLKMLEVKERAEQTVPGEMYGLPVPPTLADLYKAGPEWLTKAFHAAGTLPEDNSVKRVLEFERLPMSGKDAAGGSGPKAFLKVEYEKEDPSLHTDLFCKMPWSVGGDNKDMGYDELWRWKISCFMDNDGQEVTVYRMLGPVFPFKIPKYYFADICRYNTNFILITERIMFGKKGQESFEPYEIQPLAEKYFDFQLEPRMRYEMYYCILRAQARMAAWDKCGYFDMVPEETRGYTTDMRPPPLGSFEWPRKLPEKVRQRQIKQGSMLQKLWNEFLGEKAKQCFPKELSEPAFLQALLDAAYDITGWKDDVGMYNWLFPDYIGMSHSNLQSDNAYYWRNADGEMDCGIIDWGGLSPGHIGQRLMGSITSAEGEVLDEHEDGLLQCWRDEYAAECGLQCDFHELKRTWYLGFMTYLYSMGMNIETEVFRQTPREEWKTITTLMDERAAGQWNCRCYIFMIDHALKYLYLRWKRGGKGKRLHIHTTFEEWKEFWKAKGMT